MIKVAYEVLWSGKRNENILRWLCVQLVVYFDATMYEGTVLSVRMQFYLS